MSATNKLWRTCRIYDPAVVHGKYTDHRIVQYSRTRDESLLTEPVTSEERARIDAVEALNAAGEEIDSDPNASWDADTRRKVDGWVSEHAHEYSGDVHVLSGDPAWFYLAPIGRGDMHEIVLREKDERDQACRAYLLAIRSIEGLEDDDGNRTNVKCNFKQDVREGSIRDALNHDDIGPLDYADIMEVGAAALQRSFLRQRSGGRFQPPPSSAYALAAQRVASRSRRADTPTHKADTSESPGATAE